MQINIDAGRLPPVRTNGRRYLTIPTSAAAPSSTRYNRLALWQREPM
jgi:hypothetical protein